MASSMEQARKMVKAAECSGRLYMVSQSRRLDTKHLQLRQTVVAGEIGPVTTINCDFYLAAHFGGFREQMPSPLILDMAIHHFDLARYITGADPVAVYAREFNPSGSWFKGDAAAVCVFEMSNGILFTYRGSWCAEGCRTSWHGDWRVIGQKGTLIYEHEKPPYGEVVASPQGFMREVRPANISPDTLPHGGMRGALREMLEYLRTGQKPQTECHDNIKSLAMVFAAIESSKKGQRIEVNAY
jgi:predicted dehydrogenase